MDYHGIINANVTYDHCILKMVGVLAETVLPDCLCCSKTTGTNRESTPSSVDGETQHNLPWPNRQDEAVLMLGLSVIH